MAYEHPPGRGTLFKNNSENEKAPILKGKMKLLNGETIFLAAWRRDGGGLSLRQETPKPRGEIPLKPGSKFDPRAEDAADYDDEIPF